MRSRSSSAPSSLLSELHCRAKQPHSIATVRRSTVVELPPCGPLLLPRCRSRSSCDDGHHRGRSRERRRAAAVKEGPEQIMCPVCIEPFVDPITSESCDHTLCRHCVIEMMKACRVDRTSAQPALSSSTPHALSPPCPLCREALPWPSLQAAQTAPVNVFMQQLVQVWLTSDEWELRRRRRLQETAAAMTSAGSMTSDGELASAESEKARRMVLGAVSLNGLPSLSSHCPLPRHPRVARDSAAAGENLSGATLLAASIDIPAEHRMYCDEAGRMRRVMPSLVVLR